MGKYFSAIASILLLINFGINVRSQVVSSGGTTAVVLEAENYENHTMKVGLGDYIKVKVRNLDKIIKYIDENKNPLYLYINGVPMHGIRPLIIDTSQGYVVYQLIRDSSSLPFWNIFYRFKKESEQLILVSVGLKDRGALPTKADELRLIIWKKIPLYIFLISFIIIVAGFFVLSRETKILRDSNTPDIEKAPYSLSKSQLAFWTFLIVGSFVFIWLITAEIPNISGSTFILLAISIGTTAAAKIIDTAHGKNANTTVKSGNWFTDVLNDGNDVSIHRFQMLLWTIVFGIYFISMVITTLDLPQFSNEILALMGISNSTYLGLRIPEDSKP